MDGLTASLFQCARLGRFNMATVPTDVNEVVDNALFRLQSMVDAERVEIVRPQTFPTVSCNPVRVGEIFYNLICNAIQYNQSPAKKIIIACRDQDIEGDVVPVFMVQDNGIGIEPRFHDSIFKIFRRLHPQSAYGGGTGAGLAIVKKLVEGHHGRIWIDSKPGEGSTFYFTCRRIAEACSVNHLPTEHFDAILLVLTEHLP
ncbi:MAG TPA: ATP-binding protein [Oligoflexus sp.]|uniref:sensor histidine kinase n=1 Tax=Oligoflexus sp. TaxID=1971216 RepID=UPI002D3F6C60|nr:ATP-binding protein [Oligoflexus sp.]HYX33613.1 ATP-binding protein [Oligoflexus sp.]